MLDLLLRSGERVLVCLQPLPEPCFLLSQLLLCGSASPELSIECLNLMSQACFGCLAVFKLAFKDSHMLPSLLLCTVTRLHISQWQLIGLRNAGGIGFISRE